jgi:hypothetical protein
MATLETAQEHFPWNPVDEPEFGSTTFVHSINQDSHGVSCIISCQWDRAVCKVNEHFYNHALLVRSQIRFASWGGISLSIGARCSPHRSIMEFAPGHVRSACRWTNCRTLEEFPNSLYLAAVGSRLSPLRLRRGTLCHLSRDFFAERLAISRGGATARLLTKSTILHVVRVRTYTVNYM